MTWRHRGLRAGKFNAVPTRIGGRIFHSRKEAARYMELKAMLDMGVITDLELQPRFRLEVNGVHVCDYLADFRYSRDGRDVVEDVKGYRTREYELKRRLMRALRGIEVEET